MRFQFRGLAALGVRGTGLTSSGCISCPWGLAALPHLVERDPVLVGVHALPEAPVLERAEPAGRGEVLERLALERAVRRERLERGTLEAEEARVHPQLAAGL